MAEACVRDQKSGFAPLLCCRLHESAPRYSMVMMMSSKPYLIYLGGKGGRGEGYLKKHPGVPALPYLGSRYGSSARPEVPKHHVDLPFCFRGYTSQRLFNVSYFCILTTAVGVLHATIIILLANLLLCDSVSLAYVTHRHYQYSRYCAPSANHRHPADSPCSREHGGVTPKSYLNLPSTSAVTSYI